MKKRIFILLPLVLLFVGCEQKNTRQSKPHSTVIENTTSREATLTVKRITNQALLKTVVN
ncbi:hypothetical protein [Enterococcus lactis]|uniref:hypothetical protein n=1 Tax=Enterococcus lactis TaxID=357441 RepID=UPI0022DEA639|nr:hypothetical protein [Enterococcus lactis]